MDLDLSDEQQALRDTLVDFFEEQSPAGVVRAAEPLGFDAGLWKQAVAMGLPSIAVPEELGGGGAGVLEAAVAAACAGRSLAPIPLAEAAAAAAVLVELGATDLLGRAVAGDALVTAALHPARDGVVAAVPAGAVADVVLVLDGDRLLAVEPAGVREPLDNLGALPLATLRVEPDRATVLATGERAVAAHATAVRLWRVLTAASLVGLSERALEMGIAYVRERRAFGTLIAAFQTVQHRLADGATATEGARLLAYKAAWAHDTAADDADVLARMALPFAAETALATAADALHVHGGYGYTLEYDIQLYFRRAKAWPLVLGGLGRQYAGLAGTLAGRD